MRLLAQLFCGSHQPHHSRLWSRALATDLALSLFFSKYLVIYAIDAADFWHVSAIYVIMQSQCNKMTVSFHALKLLRLEEQISAENLNNYVIHKNTEVQHNKTHPRGQQKPSATNCMKITWR